AVVLSWSSPRSQHHAAVARKIHLSRLFSFPEPSLFNKWQKLSQEVCFGGEFRIDYEERAYLK
ncbi:hypothetical protein MB818_08925, partial [Ruegeria sp. 1NDH52C]